MYDYLGNDRRGVVTNVIERLVRQSSWLQSDKVTLNIRLPPIDLLAWVLQVETVDRITTIEVEDAAIREMRFLMDTINTAQLTAHWEHDWSNRIRNETII